MSAPERSSRPARPTIYDVAERAGVSKSLVSLVLRDSPRVSEPRREAVRTAIRELGYRPSQAAAALAGTRTKAIGLVIDDYRNLWYVDLLHSLQAVLEEQDFHVSVIDTELGAGVGREALDVFLSMRVEGLVVAMEPTEAMVDGHTEIAVPTVMAGGRGRSIVGADVVANDDEVGGRLATEHLLDLGHTRIGHLTGRGGAGVHRRVAHERRMRDAGLSPVTFGDGGETTEADGFRAASALLDAHPETTAIFAANDVMALGALGALRRRGLRAPDDVSLIGYDNSPLASSAYLDLTTIDDRSTEVGSQVGRTLLARIADPAIEPTSVLIDPELVLRSSTAAPRSR